MEAYGQNAPGRRPVGLGGRRVLTGGCGVGLKQGGWRRETIRPIIEQSECGTVRGFAKLVGRWPSGPWTWATGVLGHRTKGRPGTGSQEGKISPGFNLARP
eukprot:1026875-Heterocapsa_arctica.AAC.1